VRGGDSEHIVFRERKRVRGAVGFRGVCAPGRGVAGCLLELAAVDLAAAALAAELHARRRLHGALQTALGARRQRHLLLAGGGRLPPPPPLHRFHPRTQSRRVRFSFLLINTFFCHLEANIKALISIHSALGFQ
jgi:hypothetical protein